MSPIFRFGLIGAGRWGKVYIRTVRALAGRCRLTHLCTSNPQNATLVSHPVSVLADWRGVITSECDAVIIATPPATHAEILEACLDAGKPCLVEKPLCLDTATAERLHDRIQASGVPVLVNHTQLFTPAYRVLKQAVEKAGEPIRVILSEGMGLGPFRTHTPALWDWCPHDFSLCVDLLGECPEQVNALAGPRSPEGAPEMVSVRLDFSSGTCAWIQAGRLSPHKRRSFSVLTDTRLYLLDDLASEKLTVAPMPFSRRYTDGVAELFDSTAPRTLGEGSLLSPPPRPASSCCRPPRPSSGSGRGGGLAGAGVSRGANGEPVELELLERSPLGAAPELPPMVHVVTYFLEGLAGGDRNRFGAGLALEVTRVLAQCDEAIRST